MMLLETLCRQYESLLGILAISAWDDDDNGERGRGGYVKTHSKHKSSFNMAHSHEHGRETVRRFKRDWDNADNEGSEGDVQTE